MLPPFQYLRGLAATNLLICPGPPACTPTSVSYSLDAFDITVSISPLFLGIRNARGDVLRTVSDVPFVSTSPGADVFFYSSGNFNITESSSPPCTGQNITTVSPSGAAPPVRFSGFLTSCSGNISSVPYSVELDVPDNLSDRIAITVTIDDKTSTYSRVYFSYESPLDEGFYGFGEMASWGDLRGQEVPIFSREGGIGRGSEPITSFLNSNPDIAGAFAGGSPYTSYTAIPQYVSTRGSLFYLLGPRYTSFALATSGKNLVTVRYNDPSMQAHVLKANNMLDAITSYTDWSGRQPSLPTWVDEGAILGIQGGEAKVQAIVDASKGYDLSVAAVWLQDWCGTRLQTGFGGVNFSRLWWNWEPDTELYPNWPSFVQKLRQKDVRTLSYVNTFLANVSMKESGFKNNFYAEAVAGGRLVMNTTAGTPLKITSGPGIDAGLLDISNATTFQWFKQLVKNQMVDFGEYLPVTPDVSISSGKVATVDFHNVYPAAWSQLQREVVQELGLQDDAVAFHRSASTHSINATNLFWAGDQNTDWERFDGMRAVISSSVQMGFGGIGAVHSDIGGFTNVVTSAFNITRSAELLGRWGELGALSGAVFRSHEGVIPTVNAQVYTNASTYMYHAYNTRMFVALKAYRRALLTEVTEKGWPLVRHPVVYYPGDPMVRVITDEEYFFGASLLIAPVYTPSELQVTIYLPDSNQLWQHLWSEKVYKGGQTVTVAAPYGQPGVFLKLPREDGGTLDELLAFAIQWGNNDWIAMNHEATARYIYGGSEKNRDG